MRRPIALAASVALAATFTPFVARGAEPAPGPTAADLAAFVAFAERADEPARTYRLVGGLAALGVGGLVTPVAAVMVSRDEGAAAGAALGVGIGTAVSGALVLMGSTSRPYRDAADAVEREKALGRSDRVALAAGESVLRQSAAEERLARYVGGGIFLGLGVVALGLGTTFAAADLTGDSLDRGEQDGIAAALLIGGALGAVGALDLMLFPTPAERSWEGYATRKSTAMVRVTRFGVAPLPGGAHLGLGGAF